MYYYSCFVYHYPFEPLRQPELVNDPQRLDLQLIEPSISEHLDAVIIIDRSGSMTYPMSNLDPTQRIVKALQAAVVFAEFIETGDYASVIDFAGDVHVTRSLSHIDNKEALKVDIRSVRVGEWNGTNIGDSLLEAYKQLMYSPSGNLEKCVILLTDGAHNTGTHPLNAISQCENFISHTWPVHTIGFGSGDEFDEPLLKEIANRTGGQYERAGGKVDELGAFYAKIATEMHGGTTVFRNRDFANQGQTIIEGVEIDPLTQGAHFTLNWGGSRMNLLLKSPSGRVITPAEAQTSPDMEYFEGKIYAIYKMALPEPGRWEIEIQGVEIPAGGEEFVFSAAVNSFISSNLLPFKPSYSVSEPVPIGIILKSKSISGAYVPITNAQVRALVERPDGTSINLTLYDSGQHGDQKAQDGVFANLYTHTEVQGAHLITVSITGRTSSEIPFSREVKETVIVGAKNSIFINRTSLRPKPGTTIAERTPTISARISGPSRNIDISSIVLSVDGQTVKHAYDSVNQIVSYQPPTPLESRKHTITLQVSDTKGNSLPKSSWEFTVDAIAIIESVSLSGSPAKLGGEISVVLRAEQGGEATFSIQNVVLHIPLIETVPGTYTGTYKVKPGIDVKDATLSVFFTDTLGNETENRSQKVTIDTIPPTINMQIPKEGTLYRYGDTINFKLITEPGSTVTIDISEIAANLGIISMKENSTVPGEFYGTAIISKDNTAQPGEKTIKIKDKDAIGNVAEAIMKLFLGKPVPQENALLQNYPNPFNAETWIPYQLSKGAEVTVEIYDVSGRLIRRLYAGIKEPGFYKDRDTALRWEGRNLNGEVVSSGVYFYHIKAGSFTATRKMVIVR
jgi:Mg-chelatase subunit ChlD